MRHVRLSEERQMVCKVTGRIMASTAYPVMFFVGQTYYTQEGKLIRILSDCRDYKGAYDTVYGSDGIWRYDRRKDRGRVTGTPPGDPRNLKPLWEDEE